MAYSDTHLNAHIHTQTHTHTHSLFPLHLRPIHCRLNGNIFLAVIEDLFFSFLIRQVATIDCQ